MKIRNLFNKILKYLKYISLVKRRPGIISDVGSTEVNSFIFNFRDRKNTHIGDVLFLLPAILIIQKNYAVKVFADSNILNLLIGFGYKDVEVINKRSIEISYIWNDGLSKYNFVHLNIADSRIDCSPSILLIKFLEDCGFKFNPHLEINLNSAEAQSYRGNYFIYNNECESGIFRLKFGAERKLNDKAKNLVEKGMTPICVGVNVHNKLPFKGDYIDLRGKTNILELANLIKSSELDIITYDNAIAHLGSILNISHIMISMRWFKNSHTTYLKRFVFPLWASKSNITYL